MDNSASERELAEELQATQARVQDLESQITDLMQRIANISLQLGKLTRVVKHVMADNAEPANDNGSASTPPEPPSTVHSEVAEEVVAAYQDEIPTEMLQAIRLVTEQRSEEAQKQITSLPREMLAEYPGIVALVAAAVRIKRGELEVARAALGKARELIEDQRLLRVIKFLEKQIQD